MGENWQDCCDYYSGPWAHYDGQWTDVGDLQTKVKFTYLIVWDSYFKPCLASSSYCGELRRPTYGNWWSIRCSVSTRSSKKALYSNSRTEIEIWNEDFTEVTDTWCCLPSGYGPYGSYGYGMSAFLVPPGFCSKNWSILSKNRLVFSREFIFRPWKWTYLQYLPITINK